MADHYVNNKDFLSALIEHRELVKKAHENKEESPQITDYIGECFLKIAENLSRKPNFAGYTFRDDMISDSLENCLRSVNNFDPSKSKNPFSYFTQIIYFSFIRRILQEKKQLYTKYKATQQLGLLQEVNQGDVDDIGQGNHNFKVYDNIDEFIQTFEQSRKEKSIKNNRKKSPSLTGLLKFIGE